MLPESIKNQIIQVSHAEQPKEACGLIVDNKIVLQALNIADNPEQDFVLDPSCWADAEILGTITCIWHSHTNGNNSFSAADIRACKALGIPWYLFSLPDGLDAYFDPKAIAPYLGRLWHYGATDCYTLFRDYYKAELGIELDDFDRGEPFDWLEPDWNKFALNFEKQGFKRLEDVEPLALHDAILMQIQSPNPNHVGVIVDVDKMHMMHHLYERLSEIGVYGGFWQKVTAIRYRHIDIP